ncbi:ulp1 protease family, C-terminal catalytic domain-containing protein [Tanacetum coccineum]|uniref:Ulp1 protease family, C-terminal catalytic domain-containing protein n=1 Tax=Tanacetum coccineum TaxID=301880 RepID=A0ABQ5FPW0_9ASTR
MENTFHSVSIDVVLNEKVVHQNEREENFSDKNLMPEFDQNIEWETLINDVVNDQMFLQIFEWSIKRMQLKSFADHRIFDVPKENQSPIQPLMTESLVEGSRTSGENQISTIVSDTIIGDRHRKTWLPVDTHLDIWVLYLWRYRPAQADWAIAGPFFNTFMLGDKLPCCYFDGVTYGVPLFADSVEKAYFLINGEDNHWVLAELHIRSGVITLYDSLPPQNTLVESREWWLDMRKCYAEKFPKLLIEFDNGKEKH